MHDLNDFYLWGNLIELWGVKREYFCIWLQFCVGYINIPSNFGGGSPGLCLGQLNSDISIPVRQVSSLIEHSNKDIVNWFFILNLYMS